MKELPKAFLNEACHHKGKKEEGREKKKKNSLLYPMLPCSKMQH